MARLKQKEKEEVKSNIEIEDEVTAEINDCIDEPILSEDIDTLDSFIPDKPVEEKLVSVLAKENHTFCYGGRWFTLKKGEKTLVPYEVKATLLNSGLLLPM